MSSYVMVAKTDHTEVECLDGIWWNEAPVPPRNHECWVQTHGHLLDREEIFQRCACGACRYGTRGPWMERNSRKAPPLDQDVRRAVRGRPPAKTSDDEKSGWDWWAITPRELAGLAVFAVAFTALLWWGITAGVIW